MTDKIIDGIDVSGCGYYCEIDGQCNIFGMGKGGEDTFCRYCTDNPNCYYKQLKRLEKENAGLKAENVGIKISYINFIVKLKREMITKDDIQDLKNMVNKFVEERNSLKAENERLKEIKDDFFNQAEISHQAVQDKNKIIEKLETVMQEIKAYAERQLLVTNVRTNQMVYYADFSEYRNEILQKITKAESEG